MTSQDARAHRWSGAREPRFVRRASSSPRNRAEARRRNRDFCTKSLSLTPHAISSILAWIFATVPRANPTEKGERHDRNRVVHAPLARWCRTRGSELRQAPFLDPGRIRTGFPQPDLHHLQRRRANLCPGEGHRRPDRQLPGLARDRQGGPGGHFSAQPAALPGDLLRHPQGRGRVRDLQPALHRHGAELPAQGRRRQGRLLHGPPAVLPHHGQGRGRHRGGDRGGLRGQVLPAQAQGDPRRPAGQDPQGGEVRARAPLLRRCRGRRPARAAQGGGEPRRRTWP